MSGSKMVLAVRVDKSIDDVEAYFDRRGYGGFGVREVAGDNEHWHFLIETDAHVNIQAFRVALTKAVPELKGNGSYSVSEVKDIDKYVRYMCKGESEGCGAEVVWRHSLLYTEEKCDQLHVEYWEENRRMKKRKVGSMIDAVVDECKRSSIGWREREKISFLYVKEVMSRAKPFNAFAAKSAVNTIQMLLCPDDSAMRMFAEAV